MLTQLIYLLYPVVRCQDTDQGTVQAPAAAAEINYYQLKTAVNHVLRNEYDLNLTRRAARQIDRTDALLGGFNGRDQESHPLQRPTGEKTRKTYDFTKTHHVGLSCHDIQAS